jgi:outer membrane receptor protein involved in Fe transport
VNTINLFQGVLTPLSFLEVLKRIHMRIKTLSTLISASLFSAAALAEVAPQDLPAMVVSADFRPTTAQETPISLTTIDTEVIDARGAQHVEDVLNIAPNVNVSSGASRGQYYLIRGVGERSQFAAPLNPSVGLVIDGIDFSRTGGAATLFDIESVEILRGPQGTKFGTNALAGSINMQSTQPTEEFDLKVETGIADYDTYNLGVAVGGTLIENTLLGRGSVHTYQSDGYMDNVFLGKEDTQDRDEITARGQLKWFASDDLTVDLNVLHLDIDNGYDAFTYDNSRNSQADQPGEDKQRTTALALKTNWQASDAVILQTAATYVDLDIVYSYDADWGYDGQFAPGLFPYVGFEEFKRDRENYSFEVRALSDEAGRIFNGSTDWTIGLYHLSQDEDFEQDSDFGVFGATFLAGSYETENTALFGQLDTYLTEKLTLISGLRIEYFEAEYNDSNNLDIDPEETLFGGKIGLNYQVTDNQLLYTSLSRGYKSGGVNNDGALMTSQREIDTEYMWSVEAGVKSAWLDGDLLTNISAFYMKRKDAQVKNSTAVGVMFIDFIDNAADADHYGVEADFDWLVNNNFRLLGAVGLLHATFDDYDNVREGRRVAHAPAYNFTLGGEVYAGQAWTFRANIEGKDEFYYSNSHNEKSGSYAIVNASIDYVRNNWKVSLWGRNLFDKDYYTRGFFFGNDPGAGYADTNYTQYADPRVVGLSLTYDY